MSSSYPTLHPESKAWWPRFEKKWGDKALDARCSNCRFYVDRRPFLEFCCTYLGEKTDPQALCPYWQPGEEE